MYLYTPILFSFILNILSAKFVKQKAELMLKYPYEALPDIIHSNFTSKISVKIPDFFIIFCIFICFREKNREEFEINILCIGFSLIIRSFTVLFTIMPTCMEQQKNQTLYNICFSSTHDLMFSGHSIIFFGIGNMLKSYTIKILGPLTLILSRQHYTIDIFVASLVYFFVYTHVDLFNFT